MDDLLQKIVAESEASKLSPIVSQSHQAIEILCDKMSLMRLPMNEVRDKCFQVFYSCLTIGSKNSKLIQLTISGMQLLLRNQIYWTVECNSDEKQLPSQLIECISSTIEDKSESTQMEMLSILSEMSLTIPSLISLDNIEDIIEICCKLNFQSSKHQLAIEATASQSCHQFLKYCLNSESQTDTYVDEEIIPLLDLIINKLKFSQNPNNISVLLKCVHYFLITIPNEWPLINDIIVDIVWKTLIPTLIKHLSPIDMNEYSSKGNDSSSQLSDGKQLGRGSESLNKKQNIICYKKTIFKITSELLRLFGAISSLRPALESLFHRILLYPPVPQRLDALKWIQELFKNTPVVLIASVEPIECFGKSSRSKDLDLLHIILDSLEECSLSSDAQICLHSISAIVSFLRCLQTICSLNEIKTDIIEKINDLYPTLIDADFEGFDVRKTKYQSIDSKEIENQTKVSFETLKKRIVGFDNNEEPIESNEPPVEPLKHKTDDSFKRCFKNFKVEAYKSKLKELLGSKSMDSNNSQENEDNNQKPDNDNEENDSEKQDSVHSNGVTDEVLKEAAKLGSRSTSYEEVEEYQKSIANSSFTEGPEYEDCVEQMHDKEDSEQISDECPQTDTESIHFERNNARRFISSLKIFLPKLLALRTSVETDHVLQSFASDYCTDLFERQKCNSDTNQSNESCLSHKTIINADGIYLSTYSTLLLNLKLIHSNFYNNSSAAIPLTEQEFIEELHSSGILVYISSYWLAELYQRVLSDNLLENAGYKPELSSNTALINLLTDIDGLDSFQAGAQQLSDYRRLEKASNHSLYLDITECSAAHKLVRRLLTAFWDTILGCLATVCNSNDLSNAIAINALLGNDSKNLNYKKEMMTLSLDGLQMAAKLCIQLGLQSRCDTVFELLALSVIDTKSQLNTGTPNKTIKKIGRSVIEVIKSRQPFSLHTSHVLSLQVLLSCSLEIGSHCTACWRYVFKCCQYILELEHHYFTSRHSSLLSSTRSSIKSLIKSSDKQTSDFYSNFSTNIDSTSMPGINESEELSTQSCIEQLIAETNSLSDSVLKDKQLERVIDILSHLVDLLFEDAANKLNLTSLHSFLTELCICSTEQLTLLNKLDENCCPLKSLLLFRLSDVMLRCAKSGRPLMHFMKCWSVVASHLVEAATHSDHSVAKKSISTLHDIINVILCSHNELPHFHFNEALFKPFENLMLLELCDTDIQELIISSICEFVEGTTEEIRSGWRSLFGALRGIRLPQICRQSDNYNEVEAEKVRQLRVILDIFEAFLHTDNLQVFANAALDCMLCLIKLIKSQQNLTNQSNQDESIVTESPDLCLISMKYLDQFSSMLRSMYEMPACPLFSSSKLLRTAAPESKLIDTTDLADSQSLKTEVSLESLDRNVRILHVWFLLIEEFTQSIEKCEPKHRKTAIEILFNWLRNLFDVPGPNFAIYCVNHILLPSIQRMTRQTLDNSNISATIDQKSVSTLRHLYGLTADLVVSGIQLLKSDSNGCDLTHPTFYGMELMLRQSLLVYIECLNGRYHESVAKLSCACIRHILLSVRTHFDHTLWQTTVECLWCAHKITLQSLEVLVNVFTNKSQHFFDDFDQIQVISKRDPNEDSEQLSRLAQQIFLLDAQRNSADSGNKWSTSGDGSYNSLPIGDNRSFIFLINPSDSNPLTISYRVLIIQLTSHWLLLQTISTLVLMGIQPLMPNLNKLVDSSEQTSKPTILSLNSNQCQSLLSLLDQSYRVAFNFDSKLGLKFLIQKISRSEVPPNLYQFSSLIWSVRVVVTLFLINEQKLSNDYFTEDLKNSLKDLCERYSLVMKESDSEELTIDDICHQSLHFLQASNEELMAIIASKKLSKDIFATDPKLNEQNGDQINDQTLEDEEKYPASNCSDEERTQTPEEDIKIYSLATEEKLDSVVAEYKKFKTQLSPIPPNAGQHQKRSFNERPENSIERDSQKFTLKDSQAFTALWSEIIGYVIDLHLSLPSEGFNQLIPIFLPSIQCLTINCNNKHLRSRLSVWITRIADNLIENNENKH